MIDHLLRFDNEDVAKKDPIVCTYYSSRDKEGSWRGDIVIPNVSVYSIIGTETIIDPDTKETSIREIREFFPGWWIVISLPSLEPKLRDIPKDVCRLIVDRDAVDSDKPFLLHAASDVTLDVLSAAHVEPVFAGSNYPFGQSEVLKSLKVEEVLSSLKLENAK